MSSRGDAMCRNNAHGGRRCPSSVLTGEKKDAYNARRRARYAARKLAGNEPLAEAAVAPLDVKPAAEEGARRGKKLLADLDAAYNERVAVKAAGEEGGRRGKVLLENLDDKYNELADAKAAAATPAPTPAFVPGLDYDLDIPPAPVKPASDTSKYYGLKVTDAQKASLDRLAEQWRNDETSMVSQAEMKDVGWVDDFKKKIAGLVNEGVYSFDADGNVVPTDSLPAPVEEDYAPVEADSNDFASEDEMFAAAQADAETYEEIPAPVERKKYYGLKLTEAQVSEVERLAESYRDSDYSMMSNEELRSAPPLDDYRHQVISRMRSDYFRISEDGTLMNDTEEGFSDLPSFKDEDEDY